MSNVQVVDLLNIFALTLGVEPIQVVDGCDVQLVLLECFFVLFLNSVVEVFDLSSELILVLFVFDALLVNFDTCLFDGDLETVTSCL